MGFRLTEDDSIWSGDSFVIESIRCEPDGSVGVGAIDRFIISFRIEPVMKKEKGEWPEWRVRDRDGIGRSKVDPSATAV